MADVPNAVIKSVTRVFEVLELFEKQKTPLSSSQVSRQLQYPASSALALMKSMVELGYLSFDPFAKTYFPTVRLTILGGWIERALHLGDSSLTTVIDAVIKATGESVSLSCQNDLDMQFVYITQGPQHITVNLAAGTLAPLFHSSIGLVALSGRSDGEITRLAERHNKSVKRTGERVVLAELFEVMAQIRQRGWFGGYDMYVEGVGAVSWLLPTHEGGRGLVLSISGPTERIRANEARIVRTVPPLLREHGLLPPELLRRSG